MLVPEAAMHEDDFPQAREDQVGPTGQALAVQPVAIPHAVNSSTDSKFGLRILAADARHDAAPNIRDIVENRSLRPPWLQASVRRGDPHVIPRHRTAAS